MKIEDLTLEQKVGQVLCLGWDAVGTESAATFNAHAQAIVEEMNAGAVILMGRNVPDPDTTRALVAELQARSAVPLFVAVDQEGGMVNRFGPPFHAFPGNMALGAITKDGADTGGEAYARKQGRAQARELRSVGVNWNFAPVVDVNCNADNPIIGVRSFGEDAERVGELGMAMMQGYQEEGVLACAKHFPGHGDTSVDSHLALPTVPGNRERLDAIELKPFRALIGAGVGAIMTTHILFPALDETRPATLSRPVLTELLREELGFEGIVITDCLEMHAISETVGTAKGALLALQAGADMALICHTLETQRETFQLLLEAARSGALPIARLNEAVRRILAAKQRFAQPQEHDQPGEMATSESVPAYLDPAVNALEQEIARASITFVRHNAALPLKLQLEQSLLVISAHSRAKVLTQYLQARHANTECLLLNGKSNADGFATALEQATKADQVIVATSPPEAFSSARANIEQQAELVRELRKRIGPNLIVIALREPYDLRHFPQVENYVCAFGHRSCSLEALADALFGNFTPNGCLPVTIPNSP